MDLDYHNLQRGLSHYQRLMITAKTNGDMRLHETCVKITRELTAQIKEKTVCSQQTAS